MTEEISWKLRIEHKSFAHLWLSWQAGNIHFDPTDNIEDGDIIILLWTWPERICQTAQAISTGKNIVVVAAQEILDWLTSFGSFEGHADLYTIDGTTIRLTPYEAFPEWTWPEGLERVHVALRHPRSVLKKLYARRGLPHSMPRAAEISFPSGAKLVHLNLSLHRLQQKSWLKAFSEQCGAISWIIAGIDHKQKQAFVQNLSFFNCPLILVTDLLSGSRRAIGLPTQWLTPIVDELLDIFQDNNTNQQAFVFAPYASFRFNNTDLQPKENK